MIVDTQVGECYKTTQWGLKGQVGWSSWERGSEPPSPLARDLGEHCKLPQLGSGQSPGWNRYPLYCPVVSFENLVTNNRPFCVSNFFLKFHGVCKHPKPPPSYVVGCGWCVGVDNDWLVSRASRDRSHDADSTSISSSETQHRPGQVDQRGARPVHRVRSILSTTFIGLLCSSERCKNWW